MRRTDRKGQADETARLPSAAGLMLLARASSRAALAPQLWTAALVSQPLLPSRAADPLAS